MKKIRGYIYIRWQSIFFGVLYYMSSEKKKMLVGSWFSETHGFGFKRSLQRKWNYLWESLIILVGWQPWLYLLPAAVFKSFLRFWTTIDFQKQVLIETLGTIFTYDKHGFISIRLDWCEVQCNQSINQSTTRPTNQPADQPTNQPTKRPTLSAPYDLVNIFTS